MSWIDKLPRWVWSSWGFGPPRDGNDCTVAVVTSAEATQVGLAAQWSADSDDGSSLQMMVGPFNVHAYGPPVGSREHPPGLVSRVVTVAGRDFAVYTNWRHVGASVQWSPPRGGLSWTGRLWLGPVLLISADKAAGLR